MSDRYNWGADGVARGNFAGPSIWAIAGVAKGILIPNARDSKKTNRQQREKIVPAIISSCVFTIGIASVSEIDTLGIDQAEEIALKRAVLKLQNLGYNPEHITGDGKMPQTPHPIKAIRVINADDKCPEVSAASLIAKFELDKYWLQIHKLYPHYDFVRNAGYGAKAKAAIFQYGLIEIHRRSYKPCREYLKQYE